MPSAQLFGVVQSANQKGTLATQIKVPRKYPVGLHNNVAAWIVAGTAVTITVTDNQGGTWTKRQDITRGDMLQQWTREDVTDGFDTLIVNASSSGSSYLTAGWGEACGVGAYDTAPGTWAASSASSATPQAGSKTPTAGALLLACAHQDSSATLLTSSVIDSGWTQMTSSLDPLSFLYAGWKLHTSGAINPGYTFNTARGWTCSAMGWLADASKGTAPPTTAFLDVCTHYSFDTSTFSTPFKIQLCSVGATGLGLLFEDSPGVTITSITDSNSNVWTKAVDISNGAGGHNEFWYCKAPTGSNNLIVSANYTGTANGCFMSALKFTGTDQAAMIGQTSNTSGTDAVGTTVLGASITPNNLTNSLLVSLLGVQSNTVTAVNNIGFWSCVSTPTKSSPAPLMQNNGYGLKYAPAGAIQNTWTLDGVPNAWQEIQIEILSAAAGGSVLSPVMAILGGLGNA